jgi:hypothetical protein
MADKQPQIALDELLAVADDDHQHAGWIAAQLSKGSTLKQAMSLHKDVLSNLERCKKSADEGDGQAILVALNYCVSIFRFPPPTWLDEAWGKAYSAWRYCDADSLDDAFGVQRTHLTARRKRILFSGLVWQFVSERHDAGVPVDDQMFELAAEHVNAHAPDDLKIGKTTANEMYYAMQKIIEALSK